MAVCKTNIFTDPQRGAGMAEVLLSMAIIAMVMPFVYAQISLGTQNIRDIATARQIMDLRGNVLNFVRVNQDKWPDTAQIRLDEEELDAISILPAAGFIDKYSITGASVTDVYLAFEMGDDLVRTNRIARHIGGDAAVVADDGIAYGASWAVSAPDFIPGDLIYRVSRDVAGVDKTNFLHRGAVEDLNTMLRDLYMGGNSIYEVGGIAAKSIRAQNATATFLETDTLSADSLYFSSGAIIEGATADIGSLRVTGDMSGFREIVADNMNGTTYSSNGHVITDRATITNSINVAQNLTLKSESVRSISGFTGITAGYVWAPYISTDDIVFYGNVGLTISGELLMSTTAPLQVGKWVFPSNNPPSFNKLNLSRGQIPAKTNRQEFAPLMTNDWQSTPPLSVITQ